MKKNSIRSIALREYRLVLAILRDASAVPHLGKKGFRVERRACFDRHNPIVLRANCQRASVLVADGRPPRPYTSDRNAMHEGSRTPQSRGLPAQRSRIT